METFEDKIDELISLLEYMKDEIPSEELKEPSNISIGIAMHGWTHRNSDMHRTEYRMIRWADIYTRGMGIEASLVKSRHFSKISD